MWKLIKFSLFLVLTLNIQLSLQSSNSDDNDLIITLNEKARLDKFKQIMEPILPHEYMKSEVYLIPWLKAKHFDVPSAVNFLKENLSWRELHDMDNILNEDWTDFNSEYRFNAEGCDNDGRLLGSMFVGEWDFRKAVVSGQSEKMERYISKMFEEVAVILRGMQSDGSNQTRTSLILDCSTLSVQQQLCPRCIGFYAHLLRTLDNHYPDLMHSEIMVNAPPVVATLWEGVLKPIVSRRLSKLVHVYGRNTKEWRGALLQKHSIDFHRLSPDLGGNGADGVDMDEIRVNNYKFKCPQNLE